MERKLRRRPQPFSGRVVFDHFPKTAGQAISAWLRDVLGDGTVSPNLIGSQAELLRESGEYPIITAHVLFGEQDGLDPRFQYATLLREPLDRTLSWLYFVSSNHAPADLPEMHQASVAYLESEGDEFHPALKVHLLNPAVAHFAAILGAHGLNERELVETAFRAIASFDCVGVYERLNDFVTSLAALVGIPAPKSLKALNVTNKRTAPGAISAKLKDNILAITNLDRQLYARVVALVEERLATKRPKPPARSRWTRYERKALAERTTPALTLFSVRSLHAEPVSSGAVLRFELEFELHEAVQLLEAGFHILDDRKRWAFGANNVLLGQPVSNPRPGRYRLVHFVTAELPAGDYTIGFAFADTGGTSVRPLYWHDGLLPIHIERPRNSVGVGSSACSARMVFQPIAGLASPSDLQNNGGEQLIV